MATLSEHQVAELAREIVESHLSDNIEFLTVTEYIDYDTDYKALEDKDYEAVYDLANAILTDIYNEFIDTEIGF